MAKDIDKSIQKLYYIFLCSGYTLEGKKLTQAQRQKKRSFYIFNFICLDFAVLGAIFWFIDGVQNGKTFTELTYIAPCFAYGCLMNLKGLSLLYYESTVCDLIDSLRELGSGDEEMEIKRNGPKRAGLNYLHLVLNCSNVLNFCLLCVFSIVPLVLIAFIYFKTKKVDLILPFLILYPFDAHDIRYWPFVYLHQVYAVSVALAIVCGSDYILFICCTHLRIQFCSLQYRIIETVDKSCNPLDVDDNFEMELFELITWHRELIRLTKLLEQVYSKTILCNFVISSIMICLTGFNVVSMESVVHAVTFLVFLAANLLQIYLLCFFGDQLMKSSIEVSDAVYNCKWYCLNTKSKKNLSIVQMRAQKPCKLTAFGFSDVNLRAFMSILSSSWSYFALLKTVYNPNKD